MNSIGRGAMRGRQYKYLLPDTLYDVGFEVGNSISTVIQSNNHKPLLSATDLLCNVLELAAQIEQFIALIKDLIYTE